jgi:oxalate decarboxylase/phosphoglucose isomerase-like protein (cupin superfamily)
VRTETLGKGDVAYIPQGYGHSIENIGSARCRVLVGFNSGKYETIDLSNWIAGNPADVLATNFGKPAHCSRSSRTKACLSRIRTAGWADQSVSVAGR